MSYYYDTSLAYNVTATSNDGTQVIKESKYVFMTDQSILPDPLSQFGIQTCSIKIFGQSNATHLLAFVQQQTVLYVGCDLNNLTSYIMSQQGFSLLWTVSGLQPFIDYYNQSGLLYINAYSLAKLQQQTSIVVSVSVVTATSQRRLLQAAVDPNASTDPS